MRTQRTFQPNASQQLVSYVVKGACLTLLCLLLWFLFGWQWALLYYVLCLAYMLWGLVGRAPEVRHLLAERLRERMRHA